MALQGGGPLFIGQGGSHGGDMCTPSREFLNITRFSNLFITNSRVFYVNIFLLSCEEYFIRLPCILLIFNIFDNYIIKEHYRLNNSLFVLLELI